MKSRRQIRVSIKSDSKQLSARAQNAHIGGMSGSDLEAVDALVVVAP